MHNSVDLFFKKQIDHALHSLSILDIDTANIIVDKIINCSGKIFFAGIGKNGHVASKASSTFASIGIKAYYLDPVSSLHGDMGLIDNNDIVIAVSKSGNTEELIRFLHCLKRKECYIILVHSNENNSAIQYSNLDINLNVISECDHLNIIPTSSISVFTIFLQSIACSIAERKSLTIEQFVFNHPGGTIGETKYDIK